MRKSLLAATALMLATGLWGCKTVNTTERAKPIGTATTVQDKRISTDFGLSRIASIVGVREATVSGDMLKVQVDVMNRTANTHSFNYRFEWYDMEGMMVDTPLSTWQAQNIEGKETVVLTGIAPSPRAKDFKLKLQESKQRLP